tara:strand:- start:2231 stop:2917 length:687 start_codon:yes stop_codon:yes gene_type:complete
MKTLLIIIVSFLMPIDRIDRLIIFLKSFRNKLIRNKNKKAINKFDKKHKPFKLHIGCGNNKKNDWINIDLTGNPDLKIDVRFGLPFKDSSCSIIYSEHFLEHLEYPNESMPFLKECNRVLDKGGVIHIGVPDSKYVVDSCIQNPIDSEWLKKAKKHNWGYPEDCITGYEFINFHFRLNGHHKFAFDFSTLKSQLERSGFIDVKQRLYDSDLDSLNRAEGTLYVSASKF